MNNYENYDLPHVLGYVAIIGVLFLLRFFFNSIFENKGSPSSQKPRTEPEVVASRPADIPKKIPWAKITFLLLCIAIYATLEYENGALVIAAIANLPSSSPFFFLVPIIGSVVAYTRLVFWALITAMSLFVFNNIITMLFIPTVSQNERTARKWKRHVAGAARPLIEEDFGVQTSAVETFVRDGEKKTLLKFLNTHGVASEWLATYQKKTLSIWILVASATLLISLVFFVLPARDQYLVGLNHVLGNITISNLDAYHTDMIFVAVILLLAGFSVGTLCWAWIVKPIEHFIGRRLRHNLVMNQSEDKPTI